MSNYRKHLIIIMLPLLFSISANAQIDDPDEDEDGENAPLDPPASIDNYIIPMLIAGVSTAFYLMNRKQTVDRNDLKST